MMEHATMENNNNGAPRRRHFRPAPGSRPFVLQERDIEILRLVFELRFANTQQIGSLIDGSYVQIARRLRGLFDEGYLYRPRQQDSRRGGHNHHFIYAITNKTAQLLKGQGGAEDIRGDWATKNREVRQESILHELMIADFRAVLTLALRLSGAGEIVFWRQGRELLDRVSWKGQGGRIQRRPVYPDAWFVLRTPRGDSHFFLEADNSTMRHDRIVKKMEGYFWYWAAEKDEYRPFQCRRESNVFRAARPFRVLTITKTPQRRDNLRVATKKADYHQVGSSMFWFAWVGDYGYEQPESVLGPIWRSARGDVVVALGG